MKVVGNPNYPFPSKEYEPRNESSSSPSEVPEDVPDGSRDSGGDIWNVHRSPQVDPADFAWSNAVNTRRIFLVLLTFLAITAISSVASMYILVAEDSGNRETVIKIAGLLIALVSIGGVYYSIFHKRSTQGGSRRRRF